MKKFALIFLVLLLALSAVLAQRGRGGGFRWRGGGEGRVTGEERTAREIPSHSTGTPEWTNAPGFEKDVLTFVRIKYIDSGRGRGGWGTDAPDSDLNLSYRLQEVTSIKADPDGRTIWLTETDLTDFPFIYIVEPGGLTLDDKEAQALRKYLLNGGFLWLDDFWGENEWRQMANAMKSVFPDRDFVELSLDHPIYHSVFQIKEKRQVPNIHQYFRSGVTYERYDAEEVHHRGIFDDKGRLMVFATHNSDNGDGWEREGENTHYFNEFSEKTAYPLAINVLVYVMTH